ncbi:GGDEF domain-containing protein [Ectothiorhodospiraceae bacterium WFHF3C12]|nr:GGDEF domain-containing protein [Ectothiorhodospiraceae bacterium WFHF3C12]
MALKRLILLLSLLVGVTFVAGAVIYHATVFFNRLAAAQTSAQGELQLAAQRLTNEMVDWQRFARALSIAIPGMTEAPESAPQQRLDRLVEETYGLRSIALMTAEGRMLWRIGDTASTAVSCANNGGAHSLVNAPTDGSADPGLVHCLPLGPPAESSSTLMLHTQLDTLNYEMPGSSLLTLILVDGNGRVLAGGRLHAIERYPVTTSEAPLTGSVHLAGKDFEAATLPVAGLDGAHLVALTSHETLWSRVLQPLLSPAGIIYALMAALLAVIVRKLYLAAGRDVQRREKVEQKLRRSEAMYRELSVSDSLTGLYNRRKFHADLHHELSRNQRYDRPVSLAVMDVDYFKQINDRYGHNEGDRVLRLIGRVLRGTRRKTDTAYRVGGEEFVLMLPETRARDAETVVRRIQDALTESCLYTEEGDPVTVTMSVGIAEFDGDEGDRALFNRADAAMYEVKDRGRGGLAIADTPPPPAAAGQGDA